MTVTNHMLRKKFAETIEASRQYMKNNPTSTNNNTPSLDEQISTTLSIQNIIKVQGDKMITENGTMAQMLSPMPCTYWKCTTNPDTNGVSTLKQKITGLFISDGQDTYCIGVSGASDEFEVRLQVGTNEVRLNNMFLNLFASHLVENGLEKTE